MKSFYLLLVLLFITSCTTGEAKSVVTKDFIYNPENQDPICENFDVSSRIGATSCLQNLAKNNYFDQFKTVDVDRAVMKLVSLGASFDSAEWAVNMHPHLINPIFDTLNQDINGMYEDEEQCTNNGNCVECSWQEGNHLFSFQACFEMCQTVINYIHQTHLGGDNYHIESQLYSVNTC